MKSKYEVASKYLIENELYKSIETQSKLYLNKQLACVIEIRFYSLPYQRTHLYGMPWNWRVLTEVGKEISGALIVGLFRKGLQILLPCQGTAHEKNYIFNMKWDLFCTFSNLYVFRIPIFQLKDHHFLRLSDASLVLSYNLICDRNWILKFKSIMNNNSQLVV